MGRGGVRLRKIISGGQTGADRGALDAAMELGLEHGGWCPRGRRAEDGAIPRHYRLTETRTISYSYRTKLNILDADATLIVSGNPLNGGTAQTAREVLSLVTDQPPRLLVAHYGRAELMELEAAMVRSWLELFEVEVLNVAGPRESKEPGIQDYTRRLLIAALSDTLRRSS